jgi:hypothetical protein
VAVHGSCAEPAVFCRAPIVPALLYIDDSECQTAQAVWAV